MLQLQLVNDQQLQGLLVEIAWAIDASMSQKVWDGQSVRENWLQRMVDYEVMIHCRSLCSIVASLGVPEKTCIRLMRCSNGFD